MRKYLLPLAAGALVAAAASAQAAQTSANFQARITIQTACIVSATNLDFGNVGVINGGETATSNVSVNCSNGTPFGLSLDSATSVTAITGLMTNVGNGEDVDYSAALSSAGGTGTGSAQPSPSTASCRPSRPVGCDLHRQPDRLRELLVD